MILLVILLCLFKNATAVSLDFSDQTSVVNALNLIAQGLMDYYNGDTYGGTPGMMVLPYYWWEAGAAWGSMIDYGYYTSNDTYTDTIKEALLYQVGKNNDYVPSNQTTTEGNDDQGFWGIAVMAAAERNFSNPSPDQPQWLYLAQAVFNTMAARWDNQYCGGGLRWQIFTWNSGYNYKNTVSNGCLFHLGARLARYTNNQTYVDWAEKVYDWMGDIGFLQVNDGYALYDGGVVNDNCSSLTQLQWTYNYGLFLSGSAYLYNYTNDSKWLDRATNLWQASAVFFNNSIMYEAACQPSMKCNNDQRSFKGIFSRFLGLTALLIPSLTDSILAELKTSAMAAAASCSGGTDGHTCGLNWFVGGWDGIYGLGEQICALEVIQNNLVLTKPDPLTNQTGGTSVGDPNAGSSSLSSSLTQNNLDITTKDRAGAGIITVLVIAGLLGTGYWMLKNDVAELVYT